MWMKETNGSGAIFKGGCYGANHKFGFKMRIKGKKSFFATKKLSH